MKVSPQSWAMVLWVLGPGVLWPVAALSAAVPPDTQPAVVRPYDLEEAIRHGVVDLYYNPWSKRPITPLTTHLPELDPGLINRIGFLYGGPSMFFFNAMRDVIASVKQSLPRTLFGGGFNESLYNHYRQTLDCGGTMGRRSFDAAAITTSKNPGSNARYVDIATPGAQEFYICLGQILIDRGVTYLHFEAPVLVLNAASSPEAGIEGYRRVRSELDRYAKKKGVTLYFSGDPQLAAHMPLDGVYMPSRFFHVTVPDLLKYQNRIEEPNVGVGYTYALSTALVDDTRKQTPPRTRVFFYVDNWDESQDDLRRLMELDAVNRRRLLQLSAAAAQAGGAYFIPPLVHCEGCVRPDHVGDPCEILTDGMSEYDAYACGDFATIGAALKLEGRRR